MTKPKGPRKNYLITGGLGFIGSNYINALYRDLLKSREDFAIHCVDKLGFGSHIENIESHIRESRHFVLHQFDICESKITELIESEFFEYCINFAAESHVDRSISSPLSFFESNIMGTINLLEAWRNSPSRENRFIQIGTDEVYGSLQSGYADESSPLKPSSPYSSSKASADMIAYSYKITYGLDVVITRCTNNYGINQHSEKLIPRMIELLESGKSPTLYGDGTNKREWIHVSDHCSAIKILAEAGQPHHSFYNIGSGAELTNIEVVNTVMMALGIERQIEFIADRPGHDFRYALDSRRIKLEYGWSPKIEFRRGVQELVEKILGV